MHIQASTRGLKDELGGGGEGQVGACVRRVTTAGLGSGYPDGQRAQHPRAQGPGPRAQRRAW